MDTRVYAQGVLRSHLWLSVSVVLTAALLAAACTKAAANGNQLNVRDEDKGDNDRRGSDLGDPKDPTPNGEEQPDGGGPSGRIYAHTIDTLYNYNPDTNELVEIGTFDCVPRDGSGAIGSTKTNDAVIGLAVDRAGQVYASTYWRFIKVDATSGACEEVQAGSQQDIYPRTLAFVPAGTFGPQEALVGYVLDGVGDLTVYAHVDSTTGDVDYGDPIRTLNPSPPVALDDYGVTGGVVSLGPNHTYAIVKQVTGDVGKGNDLVAEINASTGGLVKIVGDTGEKDLRGMAAWNGKAYGFTSSGEIHEVELMTGRTKIVLEAKDDKGAPIAWSGAGSPTVP